MSPKKNYLNVSMDRNSRLPQQKRVLHKKQQESLATRNS